MTRHTFAFLSCVAALASVLVAAPAQAPEAAPVTPAALWQPGMGFMQSAHETCDRLHPADYGACFIDQMATAGAPVEAVAFARRLNARPDGTLGILRDFREHGHVDLAFVFFPLRANENQGCFLVNGSPSLIDVDDPAQLPMKEIEMVATWRVLARRYPKISLWPGNRSGTAFVRAERRPRGGQRFIFPYVLRNGCHACATIGTVRIAFDFDTTGTFIGPRVMDVRAARRRRRRRPRH
ncbi:MAG TPA: hypothetical protein VND92_01810 [Vicinamibacterales bacterium]|nr:hypothetical protein [Vicinamibacterales bacterium]